MFSSQLSFFRWAILPIMLLHTYSAYACFNGCVVDACSGQPLPNYPITYCDPNANGGIGGCTTFYTGANGCFGYAGAVGSSIQIGGTSYTYNGGPCVSVGTVSAYALKGRLIATSSAGNVILHQGNVFDVGVGNARLNGCNNYTLGFEYSPDVDLSNYCVKIELFKIVDGQLIQVSTSGWLSYVGRDGSPNVLLNSILAEAGKGTFRVRVSIKCCNGKDPQPVSGYSVFTGNFVWNPPVVTGDVEFNWIGSSYTEPINNDGNLGDNQHPNNGIMYSLGQFTCGVNWGIVPGSGAVNSVRTIIRKLDNCTSSGPIVLDKTWNPVGGNLPLNFSFNTETAGYFFQATNYSIANDCFEFRVIITGAPGCPSIEKTGLFKIAAGNPFGRAINQYDTSIQPWNSIYELQSEELAAGDRNENTSTLISLYPNPVSDMLQLNGKEEIELIRVFDSHGKLIASQKANFFHTSQWTPGWFIVEVYTLNSNRPVRFKIQKV